MGFPSSESLDNRSSVEDFLSTACARQDSNLHQPPPQDGASTRLGYGRETMTSCTSASSTANAEETSGSQAPP